MLPTQKPEAPKMNLRVGLALTVMLAMAAGRIKQKDPKLMRSLVGDAA